MITLYGLKKCSTCVKACAWLDIKTISYQFIDYRDRPIAPDLLITWSEQLGGWEKLVNRASTTWRNLSDAEKMLTQALNPTQYSKHDQVWGDLIEQYPTLIRRPLTVWHNQSVTVGFNEKKFLAEINKQ